MTSVIPSFTRFNLCKHQTSSMAFISLIQTYRDPPESSHENSRSEANAGNRTLNLADGEVEGLKRKLVPWGEGCFPPPMPVIFSVSFPPPSHFGDKSWREAKGELLEEEGDTPSILPGESVEELTLLRLTSSKSGEWLKRKKSCLPRHFVPFPIYIIL